MAIKGEVLIDQDCVDLKDAVVFVYLEDVSAADAPANLIESVKLTAIQHAVGQELRVPFVLAAEPFNPRATYIVRAHVAPHGSEEVRAGDLISMEFTAVDPERLAESTTVRVRPV